MSTHRCPVANCPANVQQQMLMCARHWRMVPKPLQAAIYETYRSDASAHRVNIMEAVRVVDAAEIGRAAPGVVPGMKALTVWQPWASLIMIGAKPYEFRPWNFMDRPGLQKLLGQRIVLHAGVRKMSDDDLDDVLYRIDEGESALVEAIAKPFVEGLRHACQATRDVAAPRGMALGTVVIGEPRRCADLFKDEIADSDRIDQHMYGWPMNDPQPFPSPIPAAGAQGFWNYS